MNQTALRITMGSMLAGVLPAPCPAQAAPSPTTYVIVNGAWGGGWDWRAIDSILTRQGNTVYRVTLTGLGERVHLASPTIGLATHIADVVNSIEWEQLTKVVLIGHERSAPAALAELLRQVPP